MPATAARSETAHDGFTVELPTLPDAVPQLRSRLESLRDQARSDYDRGRAELAEIMPADSPMVTGYEHNQRWTIAGRTDRLISLGSETYSYSGGAHGNTAFDAILWDVAGDRPLAVIDLFTNRYLGLSLIDMRFCAGLREEQLDRLGAISEDDLWADCPPVEAVALFPTGSADGPFTGFTVSVPPYIAGPYSAGPFEIDVPVTAEMLALIKSEYRASFAVPE
ncbi:MAG: DUF4163 domain-containing protein [Pseudomonadota bacterium]